MEEEGYRLLQVWVPDRQNDLYLQQVKRECESINSADAQDDIMDWLDDVSAWIWNDKE